VGSTEVRHADIRVVAATHRPLERMVQEGKFREDLYFRLSTFPIALPPLRDRATDIPLLAEALLRRVSPQRRLSLSADAQRELTGLPFPGNVRELRNLLERTALLCDGQVIELSHLELALGSARGAPQGGGALLGGAVAAGWRSTAAPPPPPQSLRDIELAALREQVRLHRGPRAALAAKLGISERSLYRKLKELSEAEALPWDDGEA
jgi:DNA-binding NtrC family response regulator